MGRVRSSRWINLIISLIANILLDTAKRIRLGFGRRLKRRKFVEGLGRSNGSRKLKMLLTVCPLDRLCWRAPRPETSSGRLEAKGVWSFGSTWLRNETVAIPRRGNQETNICNTWSNADTNGDGWLTG